jgi:uncharacterized protein (DUF58 family)
MSAPVAIDAATLERARLLHLRARQAVAGLHHGAHLSVRLGADAEFADYKPYAPGDSLRDLDWRVLARTERLVVRRHRAEQELACTLVFDASADLGSVPAKWEHAVQLVATLAVFLSGLGEPVGLVIGAGVGAEQRSWPTRQGRRHLLRMLVELARVRPAGRASLDGLFREVGPRLAARSLVAVVSDFMEPVEVWSDALAALVRRRCDLRALHVYDPVELGLPFDEPVRVRSPETGLDQVIDPVAAREAFGRVVADWRDEVRAAVLARRGVFVPAPAGADLAGLLRDLASGARA